MMTLFKLWYKDPELSRAYKVNQSDHIIFLLPLYEWYEMNIISGCKINLCHTWSGFLVLNFLLWTVHDWVFLCKMPNLLFSWIFIDVRDCTHSHRRPCFKNNQIYFCLSSKSLRTKPILIFFQVWLPFVFGSTSLCFFLFFIPNIKLPKVEHIDEVIFFFFCSELPCYWLNVLLNQHAGIFDSNHLLFTIII